MTEAAFTEIYRTNADKVIGGIYRIVRNQSVAEELMQETFLHFLAATEKKEVTSVKALLFQISHNLAVDFVRKDQRVQSGVETDTAHSTLYDQNEMDARVLRGEIISRLEKHDENFLKYYILRADYDLTSDEIAESLGISRRSVFRLRDQVKVILAEFM